LSDVEHGNNGINAGPTVSGSPTLTLGLRQRVAEWTRALKADKWALALVVAVSVYTVVWSYITILRFYALHATVYDLGLEMEALWEFIHPQALGFTPATYLLAAVAQPFRFIISPISLPQSYPLLLVVQSVGLGSGALAVYGISRKILNSQAGAFALSLSYLFYFPLGGVNWFDFHAQAFFIPLFLWAFYAYLTSRFRSAFVLFLLAAGTTYSYVVLAVLFSALTILELFLRRVLFKEKPNAGQLKFNVILLSASVVFFVYQFWYYTYFIGISFAQNASLVAGPIPALNRVEVIVLLLVPMLLLPALAPKWLAMLLPFSYLEFTSAAKSFDFPQIFQIQFTALAIPFVFIGTAFGIRTLQRFRAKTVVTTEEQDVPRHRLYRLTRRPSRTMTLTTAVLVVTIGFATVFQPYGAFNPCCGDNFGISTATDVNWTYFSEYSHLVSLIPTSAPFVLFQNSMPSVLPRPLSSHQTALVSGLLYWANVTPAEAEQNQFALRLEGKLTNVPLNYVISDPNDVWYTNGGNVSMYSFFSTMYQSGYYGLVGEASGMTVLARGYVGPLEYYRPFWGTIPSTELYSGATERRATGPFLSRSNLTGQTAWYGPYTSLSPGTYRVGFSLMTSSTSPGDSLSLLALANGAKTLLANQSLVGGNFTRPDVWTTVDMTVDLPTAYSDVELAGWYAHWEGTISIRSISLTEIAPPSVTYS
jgi:uncharacterized membrane protein